MVNTFRLGGSHLSQVTATDAMSDDCRNISTAKCYINTYIVDVRQKEYKVIKVYIPVDISPAGGSYVYCWTESSLVHAIACHLSGDISLHESILTHFKLGLWRILNWTFANFSEFWIEVQ